MLKLKWRIALGVALTLMLLAPPAFCQTSGRTVTLDTGTKIGITNYVSVLLNSQGNENAVGFSLVFDSHLLKFTGVTVGSGASGAAMNVNTLQATNGTIGVALAMPFGQSFAVGTRECVRVSFVPVQSGLSVLAFTDSPIVREISDANANVLSATFVDSNLVAAVIFPPAVAIEPASQTMVQGSNVTFSVVASGTPPFAYQWRKDGADIAGATSSIYTTLPISTADVGSYSVVITNAAGTATSVAALLNVIVPGPVAFVGMAENLDNSVSLAWSCTPGVPYVLQCKSNLFDTEWTAIGGATATSNSLALTDNPGYASQRFYRLSWSTGASSPAGFVKLLLQGNSDTYVSLPFVRPGAIPMVISSVAGNTISTAGSPNWNAGEFLYSAGVQTNTYYARFTSGAMEGRIYPITNNGPADLTVDTRGDDLSGAIAGDTIAIEPYWTIGAVFSNGMGVNISPTIGNRYTEILIPDVTGNGINLSSSKIYFFHNGLWKLVGQGSTDHGNDILQPGTYFIVRQNVATNTTLVALGAVVAEKLAMPLRAYMANRQDNGIGLARPVTVTLDGSQLVSSGAFASSPVPGSRTDELYIFDNSVVQHNKSASAIYYYWNSGWRRVGAGTTLVGSDPVFVSGAAAIVRKGTNNATSLWINSASY